MSIRLHNGYKVSGRLTQMSEAPALLRQAFEPALHRAILDTGLHYVANAASGPTALHPREALKEAMSFMADSQRSSGFFNYTVTFLPNNLALFYGIQSYRTAWHNLPEVTPFPYWDDADRPSGMSEEEWAERLEEWDQVLLAPPSTIGLTWKLLGEFCPIPKLSRLIDLDPSAATALLPDGVTLADITS